MPWPALLLSDGDSPGTHYIPARKFPDVLRRHFPKGQAWKYRGAWTTYLPTRAVAYKNVDRLMNRKDYRSDDELTAAFWALMSEAEAAGQNPPTSFADVFLSCYDLPMPRASLVVPFRDFRFGGWQMTRERGNIGKAYMYDLNKAYRWAAAAGLPDLRSAWPTKDWDGGYGVWLAFVPFDRIPYFRQGGFTVVTHEERDMFGLSTSTGCYPVFGFRFDAKVDMGPTFGRIDRRYPSCASKISRAFWGMWNSPVAPIQFSWKNGEKQRELRNPFHNPIWAAFVTSRVKMRMALWAKQAVYIFVDAIITREPCIPTGTEIGEFKLATEFSDLWIRHAGYYGEGDVTLKHSGESATISD